MKRSLPLMLLPLTFLPGCFGTAWPRGTWTRAATASGQQLHDQYECERQATRYRAAELSPETIYADCMRARGYERVR